MYKMYGDKKLENDKNSELNTKISNLNSEISGLNAQIGELQEQVQENSEEEENKFGFDHIMKTIYYLNYSDDNLTFGHERYRDYDEWWSEGTVNSIIYGLKINNNEVILDRFSNPENINSYKIKGIDENIVDYKTAMFEWMPVTIYFLTENGNVYYIDGIPFYSDEDEIIAKKVEGISEVVAIKIGLDKTNVVPNSDDNGTYYFIASKIDGSYIKINGSDIEVLN